MDFPTINLVDSLIDEVALEGLDGITLEALWQRLSIRLKEELPFPIKFMEQIWTMCLEIADFDFYELEVPREKLIIIDRCALIDEEIGVNDMPADIYEHFPIEDTKNGIKGSCKSYYTRTMINDVVKSMSLLQVTEEYGQRIVIVASQDVREKALIGDNVCPLLDLNVIQYCFLERIGRSRHYGEVTQKKAGFCSMNEDPKIMFYHRKILLQYKLITKQLYHHFNNSRTYSGSLLHLTRFYVEKKPKAIAVLDNIVNLLKTKENCLAEYDEVKQLLPMEKGFKKIFRIPFIPKVIQTDLRVTYRTLHPNATPREYQQKNLTKERMIRVVQLTDPNFTVDSICSKEDIEDEETYDINIMDQKLNVPFLKQAYRIIEESKRDGLSQTEFGRKIGATKLQSRTMLRNLVKTNSTATFMKDMGRQRVTRYVSRKFEKSNVLNKQFQEEIDKMKEFTRELKGANKKDMKHKAEEKSTSQTIETLPIQHINKEQNTLANSVNSLQDSIKSKEKIIAKEEDHKVTREPADKLLLRCASKIMKKYKLTKYNRGYQRTFLNISENVKEQNAVIIENANTQITHKELEFTQSSFYDDIHVTLVAQKPLRMGKSINEVVGFMEELENRGEKQTPSMTYRLLKRANMIIAAVKEHKVISNLCKIRKVIEEEETKEGYDVKIDKRSMLRLLQKLAKESFVKYVKLTMSSHDVTKSLTFVCDPNIGLNHSLLKSEIEKAKIEFCLASFRQTKKPLNRCDCFVDHDKLEVTNKAKMTRMTKQLLNSNIQVKADPRIGKKYGFSPKFIRMQNVHILLYYLIFEHPGEPQVSKEMQLESLRAQGHAITNDVAEEMSMIYCDEVDWKMFVPPLPKHNEWPQGWALMSDVLLRIPLSIFVKLVKVPYVLPELENYLNHPIRKHYLIKDLPSPIRDILLIARKYIYSIHATITRLCYIGLVQFGPQTLKEKDQVFIYLNQRAELMDTTSSAAGYHKIEDKPYSKTNYTFNSMQAVEKYWYDMWNICINTCLGGRLAVQGKDIILEDLDKKNEMMMTLQPRQPSTVHLTDTGITPGDRQGAAGLDSALFSHLKRNWNWGEQYYKYRSYRTPSKKQLNKKLENNLTQIETMQPQPRNKSHDNQKAGTSHDNISIQQHQVVQDLIFIPQRSRPKLVVRKVLPKKQRIRHRVKYDEVDHSALQLMEKLRVDWEPYEDSVLLVCKVAMMYLCPSNRKQLVPYTAVRDVLHTYSKSYNKTSRACHRRLVYMMKQSKTVNSVLLGVEEMKQNYQINERFDGIIDAIKEECEDPDDYEARVIKIFRELVAYIIDKYYNISNMELRDTVDLPDSIEEFKLRYQLKRPRKAMHSQGFTKDVREINDIHAATVNSVIHSSMCCGKDRRSWAYELFKIYQQYPEFLLRNAMLKIRSDQVVSIKKSYMCAMKKYSNCMPMSSSQYQFSTIYVHKFQTKWPYEVFSEADQFLVKLIKWHHDNQSAALNYMVPEDVKGIEATPVTGGVVTAIHDYVPLGLLDFDIQIPEQVIMLDPRLHEKDDCYIRIAKRYQALLMNCSDRIDGCTVRSMQDNETEQNVIVHVEPGLTVESTAEESSVKHSLENSNVNDEDEENKGNSDDTKNRETDNKTSIMKIKKASEKRVTFNLPQDDNNEVNIPKSSKRTASQSKTSYAKRIKLDSMQAENSQETNYEYCDFDSMKLTNEYVQRTFVDCGNLPEKSLTTMALTENTEGNQSSNTETDNFDFYSKSENMSLTADIPDATQRNDIEKTQVNNSTCHPKSKNRNFTSIDKIIRSYKNKKNKLTNRLDAEDVSESQKRHTRIALLNMTHDNFEKLTVADSHHAHEYFVVNSFKILHSLKVLWSDKPRRLDEFRGYRIPYELIPLDEDIPKRVLTKIKEYATFPIVQISYDDFKDEMNGRLGIPWNYVDNVYSFIKEKKELGANLKELVEIFYNDFGDTLQDILSLLTNERLVLRSGVTTVRYIHQHYTDPWLIHSYKIVRLERESRNPFPEGSVFLLDCKGQDRSNSTKSTDGASKNDQLTSDIKNLEKNSTGSKRKRKESEHTEDDSENPVLKKVRSSKFSPGQQKEVSKSVKMLDLRSAEKIKVIIKPWIRVDGVVNQRVLHRMLGAVLAYCMKHPGALLSKVQARFVPALQPYHTRELVEILAELECLNIRAIKTQPVTLFSKPSKVDLSFKPDLATEKELMIEPAISASLKFGSFLSNKMYSSDFLSSQ